MFKNVIPICMDQYRRAFSTNRNPGRDEDNIIHYDSGDAKHIAVLCQVTSKGVNGVIVEGLMAS